MGSNERGEKAWANGVGPMLKLPLVKEKIEFEKFDFFCQGGLILLGNQGGKI